MRIAIATNRPPKRSKRILNNAIRTSAQYVFSSHPFDLLSKHNASHGPMAHQWSADKNVDAEMRAISILTDFDHSD